MFKLCGAEVTDHSPATIATGIETALEYVSAPKFVDVDLIEHIVWRLTGFRKAFKINYFDERKFPVDSDTNIILPEMIVAEADGMKITWKKVY